MFEPLSSVYQVNQVSSGSLSVLFGRQESMPSKKSELKLNPLRKTMSSPSYPAKQQNSISGNLASLKRSFSSAFAKESDNVSPSPSKINKQRKLDGFFFMGNDNHSVNEDTSASFENSVLNSTEKNSIEERSSKRLSSKAQLNNIVGDANTPTNRNDNGNENIPIVIDSLEPEENSHAAREKIRCERENKLRQYYDKVSSEENERTSDGDSNPVLCQSVEPHCDNNSNIPKLTLESSETLNCEQEKWTTGAPSGDTCLAFTEYDESQVDVKRKSVKVTFSVVKLEERLKRRSKCADKMKERTNKFHAKISPTDNQAAENELRKFFRSYVSIIYKLI